MWFQYAQDDINRNGISGVQITFNTSSFRRLLEGITSETWGRIVVESSTSINFRTTDEDVTRRWLGRLPKHLNVGLGYHKRISMFGLRIERLDHLFEVLDHVEAHELSRILKEDLRRDVLRAMVRESVLIAHNIHLMRSLIPDTTDEQDLTVSGLHSPGPSGSVALNVVKDSNGYSLALANLRGLHRFSSGAPALQWSKVDLLLRDACLPMIDTSWCG